MREPSVPVRENAAEHLDERHTDWAYSKPVVVLNVLWNLPFVAIAAAVLAASLTESPAVPLRFWIAGYVLHCLLHVLCVAVEYRRRTREARAGGAASQQDDNGDGDLKIRFILLAAPTRYWTPKKILTIESRKKVVISSSVISSSLLTLQVEADVTQV